jgi:hypothetical protein
MPGMRPVFAVAAKSRSSDDFASYRLAARSALFEVSKPAQWQVVCCGRMVATPSHASQGSSRGVRIIVLVAAAEAERRNRKKRLMKISIYTIARDCIYFDFHIEAMLRHHLPLADEIIVNEGFSSDDTFDRISRIDPKIRIFRETWGVGSKTENMYAQQKDAARRRCTGDWCILLDCDEFIPEWEFDRLRSELEHATKPIVPMSYIHFYGNYRVYDINPESKKWPVFKYPIHRNDPKMRVWGDGSNVEYDGVRKEAIDDTKSFECHHMGFVRSPARLRHKWRIQHKLNLETPAKDRTPGFVFDVVPHDWFDPTFLPDMRLYTGRFTKAVVQEPEEFVRDDFKLFDYLSRESRPSDVTGRP